MAFNARILLIDEDVNGRAALGRTLPHDRYTCETTSDVGAAIERLRVPNVDVVIADTGGLALLQQIKREHPALPVILVSATGGVEEAVEAMRLGASHYLAKPCGEDELCAAVDRAIAEHPRPVEHVLEQARREPLWTLKRLTEAYTEQVLARTGGDKQRAAEILDVDRSTLYRWERTRRRSRREIARDTPPPSSSS